MKRASLAGCNCHHGPRTKRTQEVLKNFQYGTSYHKVRKTGVGGGRSRAMLRGSVPWINTSVGMLPDRVISDVRLTCLMEGSAYVKEWKNENKD